MSNLKSEVINKGRVYIAGGWFDPEQEERLYAVKEILESEGYKVFFPKEEALCKPDSDQDWRKVVFEGNVNAIVGCNFMVNITDKKDMGTIFEAGVGYATKVPIIYFAETLGDGKFNLMLAQSGVAVAQSRDQLRELLNNEDVLTAILSKQTRDYEGNIE